MPSKKEIQETSNLIILSNIILRLGNIGYTILVNTGIAGSFSGLSNI